MSSRELSDPYVDLIHRAIDESIIFVFFHFPTIKSVTLDSLEHIFQSKAIVKQLALAIAVESGIVTLNQVLQLFSSVLSNLSSRSRLIHHLERQQSLCETQDEWMDLAERIDNIQGDDTWRGDPNCKLYERSRISARVDEFVHLMRRRDIFELMFVLRGGIARNKFGLLHEGLFTKAKAGSKVLVETYHNVVCAALDFVCDAPVPEGEAPIPTDARLAFFNETRHSYGRTALLLSGGAALGIYHLGVVKALMQNRLMPRVLGGSSAGSIVCSMIATRTDEECLNELFEVQGTNAPGHTGILAMNLFFPRYLPTELPLDPVTHNKVAHRTWWRLLFDVLTFQVPLQDILRCSSEHLGDCLRTNIGEFTFQEAFDRTGRILNITVTPNNISDPPRLLNYLTAPHVIVWSAALASSSLPGVFDANRLMVKDADGTIRFESSEGAVFSDGSMEQDLPMQQLSEMFNVNHFIISQANPHAVLLASYNHFRSVWSNPITGFLNGVVTFLKNRCRTWLAHFVELIGTRRVAPTHSIARGAMTGIFVQEYNGRDSDISLIPWNNHRGVLSAIGSILRNWDTPEILEWVMAGERETWKYIPAIKSHIAEEVTLDRCVQRLRKRLVNETLERRRINSAGRMMGERVPSFFTSPSLTNVEGLAVTEHQDLDLDTDPYIGPVANGGTRNTAPIMQAGEINPGWGGMGLSGNRTTGSAERLPSAASGLFIESEDHVSADQAAGENTVPSDEHNTVSSRSHDGSDDFAGGSGMARFYYRNTSHGSLGRALGQGNGEAAGGLANDRKVMSNPHLRGGSTQLPPKGPC